MQCKKWNYLDCLPGLPIYIYIYIYIYILYEQVFQSINIILFIDLNYGISINIILQIIEKISS